MIIRHLHITGFGKFKNRDFDLKQGLNVVYGSNEAGKSTLKTFMVSMLYGIDSYRGRAAKKDAYHLYEPFDHGEYGGVMDVTKENEPYQIQRNFRKGSQSVHLIRKDTGKELPLDKNQLVGDFIKLPKDTYLNTLCMGQNNIQFGKELGNEIANYMANLSQANSAAIDVKGALDLLQQEKKKVASNDLSYKINDLQETIQSTPDYRAEIYQLSGKISKLDDFNEDSTKQISKKRREQAESIVSPVQIGALILVIIFFAMLFKFTHLDDLGLAVVGGIILIMVAYIIKSTDRSFNHKVNESIDELGFHFEENNRIREQEQVIQNEAHAIGILKRKQEELMYAQRKKEDLIKEYENLKKKNEKIEYNIRAIELAMQTIKDLTSEIHSESGSNLNQAISQIVSKITNGAYSNIMIDENMKIMVEHKGRVIPIDYLSVGTMEQIYLAIRIATAQYLYPGEQLPIIIDDIFGSYDTDRLVSVLQYLLDMNHSQIILLTCNKEIKYLIEDMEREFHYITLEA